MVNNVTIGTKTIHQMLIKPEYFYLVAGGEKKIRS